MCGQSIDSLTVKFRSKLTIICIVEADIFHILFVFLFFLASFGFSSEVKAENFTFTQAVEDAWSIDPDRNELTTNYHSASRRAVAARSWFAGGPTVSGQYFDDHAIGSNEGYTTYQGGVSVPF